MPSDLKTLPTPREMKVLMGLCLNNIEDEAHFAGVGRKTFDEMLAKGWIERAICATYETDGYRITATGDEAHERGYQAGR